MQNVLSLYADFSPGDAEELNQIISEMEEAVRGQFVGSELDVLREQSPSFRASGRLLSLPALEAATGYSKERISMFRTGRNEVPDDLIFRLRVLRKRVLNDPQLARTAILDWLHRRSETLDVEAD